MKITIEISDDVIASLPPETKQALADKDTLAKVCVKASEELISWMAGARTYQSLTDQLISWIEIYCPIIFPASKPSSDRLFNEFSIPSGRAAYVARVVAERRQSHWRIESRKELAAALKEKLKEAKGFVDKKEFFKAVPITISAMAERELRSIQTRLFEKDTTLSTYKVVNRNPDLLTVEIPSRSFVAFEKQLSHPT